MTATHYFLGIDIGGTFTDLVLANAAGSQLEALKHLTTPADPAVGVIGGVRAILARTGVRPDQIQRVVHATTLATNLILERKGADVAFVTTEGFGDIPRIGRELRVGAERYDLFFDKPIAPVPDHLIFEVPERLDARGNVLRPLDESAARLLAQRIADCQPSAVAICLLHSYANPGHEQRLVEIFRPVMPEVYLAASSEVWPEFREYERMLTTIMSAYVGPVLEQYLQRLEHELQALGIPAPLQMMQSNGGILTARQAATRAIYSIESGPAAGVVATSHLGRLYQKPNVISFDMGGTTAKAGLVQDGQPTVTHEFHVGGQASLGSRHEGKGFPIRIPVIDLAEVGAGGGSIAWVDAGGMLQVGPQSAGADPGPACYGLGGEHPTVTDADLVLGYLDPAYFLDGKMAISVERATEAIRRKIAEPLGLDVIAAAHGIYAIANASMASAIRVVTVQRGIDPRDYTVFAFGGAGPVHITRVAEEFGIPRIVVPTRAGVMSAIGLLASDITVDYVRTRVMPVASADATEITRIFQELETRGRADLQTQGIAPDRLTAQWAIDVRYKFQSHELTIPVESQAVTADSLAVVSRRFFEAYRERYGIDRQDPTELVNFRVRLVGAVPKMQYVCHPVHTSDGSAAWRGQRPAYFPEAGGFVEAAVYDRGALRPGDSLTGPAIVQGPDATVVVPPRYSATVDGYENLTVQLAASTRPSSGSVETD